MTSPLGSGQLLLDVPVALAAGAISFASPCVLPLVPGYLGYLGGANQIRGRRANARLAAGAALFVLGFSIVYVGTAIAFQAAGIFLLEWRDLLTRVSGALVIVLGIVFVGGVGPLQRIFKPTWRPRASLIGALLLGVVFAIGWTPCLGPTLGLIQAMAITSGTLPTAVILAFAYSLGLGFPFVLLALGFTWVTAMTAFLRRHVRTVNLIGGALLVTIGIFMLSGQWTAAIGWLGKFNGYNPPI